MKIISYYLLRSNGKVMMDVWKFVDISMMLYDFLIFKVIDPV